MGFLPPPDTEEDRLAGVEDVAPFDAATATLAPKALILSRTELPAATMELPAVLMRTRPEAGAASVAEFEEAEFEEAEFEEREFEEREFEKEG